MMKKLKVILILLMVFVCIYGCKKSEVNNEVKESTKIVEINNGSKLYNLSLSEKYRNNKNLIILRDFNKNASFQMKIKTNSDRFNIESSRLDTLWADMIHDLLPELDIDLSEYVKEVKNVSEKTVNTKSTAEGKISGYEFYIPDKKRENEYINKMKVETVGNIILFEYSFFDYKFDSQTGY